jgi:phospholysine phosphohistidine inorganic pyrophosphate phosphatase
MAVRGVLLDLEGVLYQGGEAIEGAADAVAALRRAGLGLRFLTNTTTAPRAALVGRLESYGIPCAAEELFTPAAAAHRQLARMGATRVRLAAEPALAEDLAGVDLVESGPCDAVVLGDLYKGFTWDRLNDLFRTLRDGAALVALHKNRVSRRDGEIALDLGPFVAALEYGADVEAQVVGKPAQAFFELALADMGLEAGEALMVGDDIEADIGGAQAAGLEAVQVETGKYTPHDRDHPTVAPDARIASIAALPAHLGLGRR